ncbi:MAG: arginase [Bacteroidetes bacterium]|nr:MAG: arginase [Bacteroidota bacterium]
MMESDIALFFEPLPADLLPTERKGLLAEKIQAYTEDAEFPNVEKGTVVIFGVLEHRNSSQKGTNGTGLHHIRYKLYRLKDHFGPSRIVDIGNIGQGETVNDTYYAVTNAISAILKQGGIALVLGGGQDLTFANYLAYEKLEQVVNLVSVDSRFDLGDAEEPLHADRFLQKIILHQPNILFNYSNLGYQTHHVTEQEIELLRKMYFDIYRLGHVQNGLEDVEPVVRNADMVSVDLTSIRSSDLPANALQEPNGFYGEQFCAISRYAGLSDKLTSFGIYHADEVGQDQRSAGLVAQAIWYFLLGVSKRKNDYPFADKAEYTKYTVTLGDGKYDVVFYKSPRSDRWWMEVPYPSQRGKKYERHFMVPCGYDDYLRACKDEIPDRWWQTYQKLG